MEGTEAGTERNEVLGWSGKRVYQREVKTSSFCKFNESKGTHPNAKDLAEQEASGPAWGGPHSKRTPVPCSPGRTFLITPPPRSSSTQAPVDVVCFKLDFS